MELARLKISGERLYRLDENLAQCKGCPGKHHKDPDHMALPQSFRISL